MCRHRVVTILVCLSWILRYEDYEKLKSLLTDLTELVTNLRLYKRRIVCSG